MASNIQDNTEGGMCQDSDSHEKRPGEEAMSQGLERMAGLRIFGIDSVPGPA